MSYSEAEVQVKRVVQLLKDARIAAAMSQYRLAKITGISREAVRLIENGQRSPSLAWLLVIAEALEQDLGDLIKKVVRS